MAVDRANDTSVVTEDRDLVLERVFDAPRELVWKAITEPERIERWQGPYGTTTTVIELDLRVGGSWRFINHGPDGQNAPFKGEYLEVVPLDHIANTWIYDVVPFNADPAVQHATLQDVEGKTQLTTRTRFSSVASLEGALASGMTKGAIETWERLAEELATMRRS